MTWLSIHIFPKEPILDAAITRWLGAFMRKLHATEPGFSDYFFTRSMEGGQHFRLRLRGTAQFFEEKVAPLVTEIFEKEAGAELAVMPFQPEIERFGGAEAFPFVENYFAASSQTVFQRIFLANGDYDQKMGDALQLHLAVAAAADFTNKEAAAYFRQLSKEWMPAFFMPEHPLLNGEQQAYYLEIERVFNLSFEKQADGIRAAVANFWGQYLSKKMDESTANWLKINELLLPNIPATAWPDLMHMTNNRLGITNQDEVFLMYVLGRSL